MSLFDSASLVVTPNGYKEDKLYSIKPTDGSGDLVVTRATTATRVNSAGLIESVPYNFLERSQEFDNATFWGVSQLSISANATVAPDGTNTADKLIESNTNAIHEVYTNTPYTLTAGSNYTKSVYAKSAERTQVALNFVTGGFGQGSKVIADLSNGTLGTITNYGGITDSSATITNVGNGWYRISITMKPVTTANFYADFAPALSGNTTYLGNGTSGIYIWGAQLVTGTSAKEYFPTTDRLDVPRLDYTNSSCPSILVEPQRTNLLTYSEDFSNVGWLKFNSNVTANTAVSPDGNTTADTLNVTSTGGKLYRAFVSTAQSYTLSVFIKKGSTSSAYLNFYNGAIADYVCETDFNLINGTFTGASGGSAFIQNYNNDYWRIGISYTLGIGVSEISIGLTRTSTASSFIWGAQLEAGSYATSYIPTVASSVTRNADVISKTGISSLIGQTEGTMFCEIQNWQTQLDKVILALSDGSLSNYLQISSNSVTGDLQSVIFTGGTAGVLGSITPTIGQNYKIAIGYKLNDYAIYINGTQVGTFNSKAAPSSLTRFDLGSIEFLASNYQPRTPYKVAALWKTRLSNTELASLTTI